MTRMKDSIRRLRLLGLLLALVLLVAACGDDDDVADDNGDDNDVESPDDDLDDDADAEADADDEAADDDAAAEAEFELIVGHQLETGTPFDEGLHEFAELVEEKTDGRVVASVHPNAEVGSELEMFEGLADGTVDGAIVAPGSIAEFVPETNILSLPFLVNSREARDQVLESDGIEQIEDQILQAGGGEVLGYFGGGIRNMFFTDPVDDADDMSGRLLRVQPSPVLTDSFSAIGLEPTVVDYAELYNALEQGVVDGAENESVYVESQRFYEPAPYLVMTQHEVTFRPFVFSEMRLMEMPEDLADLVREAGAEASQYARDVEAEEDDAALERVQDEGAEILEIDTEPLEEQVTPVWEDYAGEWGMEDFLQEIMDLR